jgi:hypothetical protein
LFDFIFYTTYRAVVRGFNYSIFQRLGEKFFPAVSSLDPGYKVVI